MAAIIHTNQVSPEELLRAAAQLPAHDLETFVAGALALRARRQATYAPAVEADLLRKINRGLPFETRQRLNALSEQCRAENLTPAEHEELLRLIKRAERYNVQRLAWLGELARLRRQTLDELMRDLGLNSAESD
jgi:hypothetical protein